MTIAAANPLESMETPRKTSWWVCRPWLAVVLAILLAIQAVLTTGAWEYPYARMLIPDVIRTQGGFAFPPMVAVNDDYIVGLGAPAGSPDDPSN
jgi:hypothetical protein